MVAYLTDDTDFHQGRVALHTIKSIVALEGGNTHHMGPLELALHYPFGHERYDLQCPLSLLFILPHPVRLGTMVILWEESVALSAEYGLPIDEAFTPLFVLLLHARVLGCSVSPLLLEVVSRLESIRDEVSFLTRIPIPGRTGLSPTQRLSLYLQEALPEGSPLLEPILSLSESANRQRALAYIAKGLGYSDESSVRLFNAAALYMEEMNYV